MDFTSLQQMQPTILLGILNDKLRHQCHNIEDLSYEVGVEARLLQMKMASIGYHYNSQANQFTSEKLDK